MAHEDIQTRVASVLEDPSAKAVARVYSDAFLHAAQNFGVDEALEEFASFLDDVLDRNPEFAALLTSDVVSRDDKVAMIDRSIAPHASELFANFLRVLARHDRLDLLPLILSETRRKHEHALGQRRVKITSARPLSDDTRDKIQQRLEQALPFEPILDVQEDPAILGGLIIQIGDTVYDCSLRNRLRQLRDRFTERSLHEIQSGRDRFSSPEGD